MLLLLWGVYIGRGRLLEESAKSNLNRNQLSLQGKYDLYFPEDILFGAIPFFHESENAACCTFHFEFKNIDDLS